jgi:transcriptional regulator with GAF, ATPase, and Fis domain
MVGAKLDAWFTTIGVDAATAQHVVERLQGIHFETSTTCRNGSPGVVLVDTAAHDLPERITELADGALARLLLIFTTAVPNCLCWQLISAGASEIVTWMDNTTCAAAVKARLLRWKEVDQLMSSPAVAEQLVGTSPAWVSTLRRVVETATFTEASILLLGENGTGKEAVARLIHALDRRPNKGNFVTIDCSTIVPELSGSEFFGHERGAFTGAVSSRDGAFGLAHTGTLFLDEVGELPLTLQAQLLRIVQEGTFKRVGGNDWLRTRFRLVSATNRDLVADIGEQRFRRDFFHRLATFVFRLPALRDRPADILPLAEHFARQELTLQGDVVFDQPVRDLLLQRGYPGNVRELRQLVLRLAGRHVGNGPISVGDISPEDLPSEAAPDTDLEEAIGRAVASNRGLDHIKRVAGDSAFRRALEIARGNAQEAAHLLKISDRAVQAFRKERDRR